MKTLSWGKLPARGIPAVERSVMLGYVSRMYSHSVCVSGTHGKTTTTGMITTMLELAGKDPAAVIGVLPRSAVAAKLATAMTL